MQQTITEWHWQFGGGMESFPPFVSWLILSLFLSLFLLVAWISYRFTLRKLSPTHSLILFSLRLLLFLLVALCLANPTRVQKVILPNAVPQNLEVLVDRSLSMTRKDNRNQSRLDLALRNWNHLRAPAEQHFKQIHYHAFSHDITFASSLEETMTAPVEDHETNLFNAVTQVLQKSASPSLGGILCITDGLDTSTTRESACTSLALQAHVPIYFLTAENRLQAAESLRIRDVTVPHQALRQTEFTYQAVIDVTATSDSQVPISLNVNGAPYANDTLTLKKGHNLLSWSKPVQAGEPGDLRLDLQVGPANAAKTSVNLVPVVASTDLNLLYYQGTLEWGFHFLNTLFQHDSRYHVTALFNPGLGAHADATKEAANNHKDLPSTANELNPYQIVLLDSVLVAQLTDVQEEALVEYVRNGGAVLFILPNTRGAREFSGSKLEEMLPVVFEPTDAAARNESLHDEFRRSLADVGGNTFGQQVTVTQRALQPFAFPEHSPLTQIFKLHGPDGDLPIVPMFVDYAAVRSAKPAAQILAVHPTEKSPTTGEPRILLASQTFGKGRSSVLTTDSLWRWRLSLPSDSPAPSVFWQQLLQWLAPSSFQGPHFAESITESTVEEPLSLTVTEADARPDITIQAPDRTMIPPTISAGNVLGTWKVSWTPTQLGLYEVIARLGHSTPTHHFLTVTPKTEASLDLANLPPDLDRMSQMAALTGGELIRTDCPAGWLTSTDTTANTVLSEKRDLLWNRSWVLALCGLVYTAELLLRRRWKLL